MAKLSYETLGCRPAGERFFHLGINGADDLFSALLVAGCQAARQNALQHDVGCYKAALVLHIMTTTAVVAVCNASQVEKRRECSTLATLSSWRACAPAQRSSWSRKWDHEPFCDTPPMCSREPTYCTRIISMGGSRDNSAAMALVTHADAPPSEALAPQSASRRA